MPPVEQVKTVRDFLEELTQVGADDFLRLHPGPVLVQQTDGSTADISEDTSALELPLLAKSDCSIGRSPAADVTLSLTGLSKLHAALSRSDAGEFFLEDLGSKNGTQIDGKSLPAGERFRVRDGALCALGPYTFGFYTPRTFMRLVAKVGGEPSTEEIAIPPGLGSPAYDPLASVGATKWATVSGNFARRSIQGWLESGIDELKLTEESGLEAVIEVSRYLSSLRSLSELLEKILESVVRVMGAERGALLKVEKSEQGAEPTFRCITARRLDPANVVAGSNEISFGVLQEAYRSGEAILTDNALADERFKERKSVMATVIRSVLCAPIRTRERTLGFVYLDRRITAVPFNEDHRDLLAVFCTQVAVAWENALAFEEIEAFNASLEQKVEERTRELGDTRFKLAEAERDALEAEMRLARQIQQSILPSEKTLERPGLRVRGRVMPASFCGGDFWWLSGVGDKTLLLIADVTGHGMAASMITAVAGACLDTLTDIGSARSVSEVLQTLNRVVYRSAGGRLCATAFCALYEPAEKRLEFASAGHNFPYLIADGDGGVQPLVARGARLGESPDRTFEEQSMALSTGQRLVLFSDGLVEWGDDKGRMFGERRFRKSLEAHRRDPLEKVIELCIADAEAFSRGFERDDDLSIVVVDVG